MHRYLDIPLDERLAWLDNIPQSIRDAPQWLTFKLEKDSEGKYDKVPYYTDGGRRYGTQGGEDDRARLVTFNRALACVRKGRAHGVGFAPLPGGPVSIIDFDGAASCVRNARILARTWSETSVGGAGAHAMVFGDLGSNRKDHKKGIEIFSTKGFVALTGEPIIDENGPLRGKRVASGLVNGTEYEPKQTSALNATFYNEVERKKIIDAFRVFKCKKVDYEQWIKVGQALHSADPNPDGPTFKLWLRWSKRDPERYKNEDDLLYHWKSFKSHGITLATLYGYAKEIRPAKKSEARPSEIYGMDVVERSKDPVPIVPGLLGSGLGLIWGKPKVAKKTFFALQLAASLSVGDSILGYWPPKPLDCIVYMLEQGKDTDEDGKEVPPLSMAKKRLREMGLSHAASQGRLKFRTVLPPLGEGGIEIIDQDARTFDVIVIDSLQMIFNEDAEKIRSAFRSDFNQLLPLQEKGRQHHCAILVIAHSGKDSDKRDAEDAGATTSGTNASADGTIVIQHPDQENPEIIKMTIHHRDFETDMAIECRWNRETCRFEKLGSWLGSGKLVQILDSVIQATRKKDPVSTLQISRSMYGAKADANRANVNRNLAHLKRMGLVEYTDTQPKLWSATPQALRQRSEAL